MLCRSLFIRSGACDSDLIYFSPLQLNYANQSALPWRSLICLKSFIDQIKTPLSLMSITTRCLLLKIDVVLIRECILSVCALLRICNPFWRWCGVFFVMVCLFWVGFGVCVYFFFFSFY